jgi:hypothetical protein
MTMLLAEVCEAVNPTALGGVRGKPRTTGTKRNQDE